jgi:hypothetical protein
LDGAVARNKLPCQTAKRDGMSDEPKKRSRKWIWWTVLALFVIYPLSMGPYYRWVTDNRRLYPERSQMFFRVYAPLVWFANTFDSPGKAMSWYLSKFDGPLS